MAEKILNTRIQLKYDSWANWEAVKETFKPLKGEVCIVNPGTATGSVANTPCLMKVGDGENFFKDLPWVSAPAADVHAWAKAAALPVVRNDGKDAEGNDKAAGNVISSISWNNNGIEFTTASVATSEGMAQLQTDLDAVEKDIADNRAAWELTYSVAQTEKGFTFTPSAGDGVIVTFDYVTPEELAAELAKYVTLESYNAHLEAQGLIDAEQDRRIKVIEDDYLKASEITEGATNGTIAIEGTDVKVYGLQDAAYATVASLNETAKGYADAVENKLGALAEKDTITKDEIDNFATEVAAVKVAEATTADKVAHKFTVNGVEFDGSAEKSVTIDAASLGLESAMHFVGALSEAPAETKPGDVYLNTATKKEYVYSEGQGWVELGDEGSHALKDVKIQAANGLEVTAGGTLAADTTIGIANGGVSADHLSANAKALFDAAGTAKELVDALAQTHSNDKEALEKAIADVETEAKKYTDNEILELALGSMSKEAATDYVKKDEATGFNDIFTNTAAEGKADKVSGATAGNFAGLDSEGNLTDSGSKAADFATAAQGEKADSAIQNITVGTGLAVSNKDDNNGVEISFDDAVTFIFNCGDANGNPLV